jgi:3-oxoadipate enol-lactonase
LVRLDHNISRSIFAHHHFDKEWLLESATTGFLETNGARLYYETVGQGPAVLFIHAGVADLRMWDAQVEALADRYRIIRYDTRGYGKTEDTDVLYSNRQDARDLLDHLGVDKAIVVGCSRGGQIAIDFTVESPERVAGLVPVCAGLSGFDYENHTPPNEIAAFEQMEALEANGGSVEEMIELDVKVWVDGFYRNGQALAHVRDYVRRAMGSAYAKPKYTQVITLSPPAAGRLGDIRVPTLVVVGEIDTVDTRVVADALVAGIPNALKAVIEGTAHLPNMEKPDEFNRLLRDFLDGI